MNATPTMMQLPPRYYSELVNDTLFDSILSTATQSNQAVDHKALYQELVYLLDLVAISTVLQSIPDYNDRVEFLHAYPTAFKSSELLFSLTDVEKIQGLLSEKLDRALLALT